MTGANWMTGLVTGSLDTRVAVTVGSVWGSVGRKGVVCETLGLIWTSTP